MTIEDGCDNCRCTGGPGLCALLHFEFQFRQENKLFEFHVCYRCKRDAYVGMRAAVGGAGGRDRVAAVVLVTELVAAVVVTETDVLHWLPAVVADGNGGGAFRAFATAWCNMTPRKP